MDTFATKVLEVLGFPNFSGSILASEQMERNRCEIIVCDDRGEPSNLLNGVDLIDQSGKNLGTIKDSCLAILCGISEIPNLKLKKDGNVAKLKERFSKNRSILSKTKIIVVSHYEHIGTNTDGADLSKKIEEALIPYSADEWVVRSATTSIHTSGSEEGDFRPDTTYTATIILDKKD